MLAGPVAIAGAPQTARPLELGLRRLRGRGVLGGDTLPEAPRSPVGGELTARSRSR